ncbi:hypothetical protein HDV57DRAFT_506618 [Trichoderma longibrachiatum]|uniref:Uncharacterized protein n=1 Tax=Trichoderma longibrachiatum ATCC 18648 TaxID=983965 RepID=A0A2T4BP63_TRILO|nr:hypothetical protein M440DRAFT_1406838 [Trichoderma longibrachiatum ATCC 18648]
MSWSFPRNSLFSIAIGTLPLGTQHCYDPTEHVSGKNLGPYLCLVTAFGLVWNGFSFRSVAITAW